MSAQVFSFSASVRPSRALPQVSASVVVLADRRAQVEARVTCDPLTAARSWWDFWAGVR